MLSSIETVSFMGGTQETERKFSIWIDWYEASEFNKTFGCVRSFDKNTIYSNATLYVPSVSIDSYKSHPDFGKFEHIEPLENYDPTGVKSPAALEERSIVKVFDLQGRRLPAPRKGLNIIHYSDGQVTKEWR